jgi:hypothetical protein
MLADVQTSGTNDAADAKESRMRKVWWAGTVAVVCAAAVVFGTTAAATPASAPAHKPLPTTTTTIAPPPTPGYRSTTVASATFGPIDSHINTPPWMERIRTRGSSDLYVQQNDWDPAGCSCLPSTGWHTHDGPSLVIVTTGTITEYDGDDPTCAPHVYTAKTANDSFIDPGDGHVHIIRDESGAAARTIAVQLIPSGAPRKVIVDDPGNCSF